MFLPKRLVQFNISYILTPGPMSHPLQHQLTPNMHTHILWLVEVYQLDTWVLTLTHIVAKFQVNAKTHDLTLTHKVATFHVNADRF